MTAPRKPKTVPVKAHQRRVAAAERPPRPERRPTVAERFTGSHKRQERAR